MPQLCLQFMTVNEHEPLTCVPGWGQNGVFEGRAQHLIWQKDGGKRGEDWPTSQRAEWIETKGKIASVHKHVLQMLLLSVKFKDMILSYTLQILKWMWPVRLLLLLLIQWQYACECRLPSIETSCLRWTWQVLFTCRSELFFLSNTKVHTWMCDGKNLCSKLKIVLWSFG